VLQSSDNQSWNWLALDVFLGGVFLISIPGGVEIGGIPWAPRAALSMTRHNFPSAVWDIERLYVDLLLLSLKSYFYIQTGFAETRPLAAVAQSCHNALFSNSCAS